MYDRLREANLAACEYFSLPVFDYQRNFFHTFPLFNFKGKTTHQFARSVNGKDMKTQ